MPTTPVTPSAKNGARNVVGGAADRRNRKVGARRSYRREAACLTRLLARGYDADDADFTPSNLLTDRDIS
jgi:hypothetical protein